ncbi:MAG: hypothetical protein LLG05_16160 [Porphyromonadaceae bacterium]|nr:hypothetical protein [Porphyromonadaceae bacterium]
MKRVLFLISIFSVFLVFSCASKEKSFKVKFDNTKEVSGKKFAIKDINPDLPIDWDDFNFVILEFKITTAQRFQVGFTTDEGYNELRVMSYVPNAWNRLAIPLKFYRELPEARHDLAATFNQPRYTGWINLGGKRTPLTGVDSIGIRMRVPIGNPEFEIRNIMLSVEDPGDQYLETIPAVDEFGQSNLVDYEDKIKSLEQLQTEWMAEEKEQFDSHVYNYSKYGGYKQKKVKATGFFRTEQIEGKWWFVDPEGYLFLSVGVDCIHPSPGGLAKEVDKRENMFKELPPRDLFPADDSYPNDYSFGLWNLYRRYGEDYRDKANEMVIRRMEKWGINTIANWSSFEIMNMNRKAFVTSMRTAGVEGRLMGLADVYTSDFKEKLDESIRNSIGRYKDNPWVIGFFVGNEPAWIGHEERVCTIILDGEDCPIKTKLTEYMTIHGKSPESCKRFVWNTFELFLQAVKEAHQKYDPHHLNLGYRFGNLDEIEEDVLLICSRVFDVLSFNSYALQPSKEMMDRALRVTNLPMMIGEYHFGTVDRGMAQSLWQVDSQEERGVAYRYYTEQAYSHPGLIGTAYFQWADQDITGRRSDGENYNCGLIDVTDRPYGYQVEAMQETAKVLFDVHTGSKMPYSQKPKRARGHEAIPDLWD